MQGNERAALDRECAVFCRYLVSQAPTPYVLQKYSAGCAAVLPNRRSSAFDRVQLRMASVHPLLARLADAYARFFKPRSLLRVKLILLLAILESSAPTEAHFRRSRTASPALVFLNLFAFTLLFALTLVVAVVVFLPIHLVVGLGARSRASESQARLSAERT